MMNTVRNESGQITWCAIAHHIPPERAARFGRPLVVLTVRHRVDRCGLCSFAKHLSMADLQDIITNIEERTTSPSNRLAAQLQL
jgi:hypothetical protein